MRRSNLATQACVVALVAALLPVSLTAQLPFPGTVPGSEIGLGLPAGFESSGAAWHVRLERLFVVDDGGTLACMDAQGGALQTWSLAGRDLEAVCVADPGTDFVYLGVEHPDSIIEFDLATGLVTREFDLTGTLTGSSNQGLEALTFARDPTHAEGGLFYAGLQADGRVYEFELSIASSAVLETVTHLDTLVPAPTFDDISGLDWDVDTDSLYACYDSFNQILVFDRSGSVSDAWVLPGDDQEGVALKSCGLFVTQDTGEVLYYAAFSDPGSCDTASVDLTQISLAAGGVQTIELDFGAARAGANYFVLGSLTDTLPGFSVGNVLIPLVVDAYFNITIKNPNTAPFGATLGTLDGAGRATATFTLPPGVDPGLAGLVLYHSALIYTLGVVDASNPVPLTLVP